VMPKKAKKQRKSCVKLDTDQLIKATEVQ